MEDRRMKKRKGVAASATAGVQKRRKMQPQAKPKRVVDADALPWKTVKLPEMFDDAEGFFGLEEIEGVDVVKQGDSVKFVAAVPSSPEPEDGDDFEGFDDAPEASEPPADARADDRPAAEKPSTEKAKKVKAKQTKASKGAKSKEDDELESNVFATLTGLDAGEEDVELSAWMPLDLSPRILSSLARLKFSKPTAIQAASIPEILAGHDVIGKASTGSGKTLAFGIPIVQNWLSLHEDKKTERTGPIALVMSPTRELAHQLTSHIKELCSALPEAPYVCSVTGGLSLQKQQRQLEKADIVIGTPGRLWEVLSSSKPVLESFRGIRFLVIDEADRLLNEGHFKEAEEILNALDRAEMDEADEERELAPRQTLVFSATLNKGLQQKLAGKGKYDLMSDAQSMEYLLKKLNFREESPKFIDVNPVSQMAEGLKEGLVECGAMEKDLFLYALLLLHPTHHILVFTNSISAVRRLTPMLQNLNLPVHSLHSQMPQKARLRSIERFTASTPNSASILIATDVAARGLDIPGIDVVIHYHVPRTADSYVHRSGRTARAKSLGLSILLCSPDEVVPTRRLIAKVHATAAARTGKKRADFFVQTIDIDRRLAARLKERVSLAKQIADSTLAKERGGKEDSWMRQAADELGVEYDSEEIEKAGNWAGRGSGRKSKEKEARNLGRAEVGALRAQLKQLLSKRINTGVSEKYIASGTVDMDELLKGAKGDFLGHVAGLDLSEL